MQISFYLFLYSASCFTILFPGLYKSKAKYPVIVFIHGESFEWNSGNPYDGSVLASYGDVVVVTINFRLGILGFLRPGVGDNTLTNFGLLDQIAALQWVKENIEQFGGDPKCVTLMGHGTGAACVNYLMVSPVSRGIGGSGLFHRAILMSGTALADWALTKASKGSIYTIQVAQALNCPLKETNNEMAECLRKRRLDEIMAVKVEAPEFKTKFGPMVDGSVVPNDPFHLTGEYKDLFGRYELLYGVTELESYNLLDTVSLHYGMLEEDRDKKIRSYVEGRFEYLPDMYLAETLKAYTDVTRRGPDSSSQSIAENNRDTLLDILSDARVVAPMVQTANFHSSANPKSYFYVFSHRNTYGDYAGVTIDKSIQGEELPYVFGVPLVNGHFPKYPYSSHNEGFPSHPHFTDAERLLSEAVMTFWTNFAKTGNPNAPLRPRFGSMIELEWPEYDPGSQVFLSLGIPPVSSHLYRSAMTSFWNTYLPEAEKNTGYQGDDGCPEAKPANSDVEAGTTSTVAISIVVVVGLCLLLINLCACAGLYYQRDRLRAQERLMKRLYGDITPPANNADLYIKQKPNGRVGAKNVVVLEMTEKKDNNKKKTANQSVEQVYEAVRSAGKLQPQKGGGEVGDEEEDDEGGFKRLDLSRQCSASTIDPHTKVREWIASEMVVRYPLKQQSSELTFQNSMDTNMSSTDDTPDQTLKLQQLVIKPVPVQILHKPVPVKKVSVAIDATPTIIMNKPVQKQKSLFHVSKSMENLGKCVSTSQIVLKPKKSMLKRSETLKESLSKSSSSTGQDKALRRSKSISLENPPPKEKSSLPIMHKHSKSDPVSQVAKEVPQREYKRGFVDISLDSKAGQIDPENNKGKKYEKSRTLPTNVQQSVETKTKLENNTAMVSPRSIRAKRTKNVSADGATASDKKAETLEEMKRRNYPKVLPDLPQEQRVEQAKEFQKEWALVRAMASKGIPATSVQKEETQTQPYSRIPQRKIAKESPYGSTKQASQKTMKTAEVTKIQHERQTQPTFKQNLQERQIRRPPLRKQYSIQCPQCTAAMIQQSTPTSPSRPRKAQRADVSTETKGSGQELEPKDSKPTSISSVEKTDAAVSNTGTVKRLKQTSDAAFQTEEETPTVTRHGGHEGCAVCETLYGHLNNE